MSYADLGQNKANKYTPGDTIIGKDPSLKNNSDDGGKTGVPEWLAMSVDYRLMPGNTVYLRADSVDEHDGSANSNDKAIVVAADSTSVVAGKTLDYDTYANFNTALAEIQNWNVGANGTQWTDISSTSGAKKFFVYNSAVNAGSHTNALFTGVKIPVKTLKYVKVGSSGDIVTMYEISVQGASTVDSTTATTALTTTNVPSLKIYVPNYPNFDIKLKGYAVQSTGLELSTGTTSATTELQALYTKNHTFD